jgi:hypothetical protein
MGRGNLRISPALVIASIALFAALGGSVYAAKKTKKIDGRTVKVKSLPGNRLALGSVPANRLKPGTLPAATLAPSSVTGTQIDAATLGQVPSAVHAVRADSATDAETALHAVNAVTAEKINGYTAGCLQGTRLFAGSCWEVNRTETAVTAPAAALACANKGGVLPDALTFTAFAVQPGSSVAADGEWTTDIATFTSLNAYGVGTVNDKSQVGAAISTEVRKYRCVFPLVG